MLHFIAGHWRDHLIAGHVLSDWVYQGHAVLGLDMSDIFSLDVS